MGTAHAFVAVETSPGVVQLRSTQDRGLVVSNTFIRTIGRSKKNWTYFCLSERDHVHKIETVRSEKCFYGPSSKFKNIRSYQEYKSLEFGLQKRVYNDKGYITIGTGRYFYPIYHMYAQN